MDNKLFYWLSIALDFDRDRGFDKMHCNGSLIISTDGCRVHTIKMPLKEGTYSRSGEWENNDYQENMVEKVRDMSKLSDGLFVYLTDWPIINHKNQFIYKVTSRLGFNADYIKDALALTKKHSMLFYTDSKTLEGVQKSV